MEIMPNFKNSLLGYLLILVIIIILLYSLNSPMPFAKTIEIFFFFLIVALIGSFFTFLEFKSLNGIKLEKDKLLVVKAYDSKIIQEIPFSDIQKVEIKEPYLTSTSWFIRVYRYSKKNPLEVIFRSYMSRTKANQFAVHIEANNISFNVELRDHSDKIVKRFN